MKGDLVEKLTEFGLSVNQAKVYLAIIQFTTTQVSAIAKATNLHKQDIYKILPKLEEMGLITQTIGHPATIKATPAEEALNNLIILEQQKDNRKIKHLKESLKELANAIEENQKAVEITTPKHDEAVMLLSSDRAIKNRLDATYKNARSQCDIVLNFELLMRRLAISRKRYQILAENNVKTRILIAAAKNQDLAEATLKEVLPHTGDFTVKLTKGRITVKPYIIIDNKEIYIATQKKTQLFLPCLLWTNSQDIIHVYKDNFEKAWNRSAVVTIHTPKT